MLAITQAKTLVNTPVRASRACARVIARANADDVNRRSFIRRAGFAALSLTVATPEEVRERNDARS
jgi:ribosomal protein S3